MNLKIVSGHLAAFAIGYEFEVHFLAFAEVTQTGTLHSADMDERIRPPLIGCDEAEAFLGIEPFDGSGWHEKPFQKTYICSPAKQPAVGLANSETKTSQPCASSLAPG